MRQNGAFTPILCRISLFSRFILLDTSEWLKRIYYKIRLWGGVIVTYNV